MTDEPFINEELLKKLENVYNEAPDEETQELMEEMHLSELARMAENMDKYELLIICMVAVKKHPWEYFNIFYHYTKELEKRRNE